MVGGGRGNQAFSVESGVATAVFWGIMLFAVIAALEAFGLDQVSEPLRDFLRQITLFAPRLLSAAVLAGVAWLLATVVKSIFGKGMESFGLGDRLSAISGDANTAAETEGLNDTLANLMYWLVWLLFLPAILGVLGLSGILGPIQGLVDSFLAAIPRLVQAAAYGFVFYIVAKIVSAIVSNFAAAAGADRLGAQMGLTSGGQSLSKIAGTVVSAFILLFGLTTVLDTLQIEAVSASVMPMLNQITTSIPLVLTAGIILTLAFFIGRFLSNLVTQLLSSMGFDNIVSMLGFPEVGGAAAPAAAPADLGTTPAVESKAQTPSAIAGTVVFVGIMLVAAMEAVNALGFDALTNLMTGVVEISARVLTGGIVMAIGLYIANLVFRLVSSTGMASAKTLAQAARIAILVLVGAMALQLIGIAPDIINLAFGLTMGGIAVAIALAFGLGGREVAGQKLKEWLSAL
ncbi:MAG: mechanosensitive ion channel [Synechococcales cyanobacterium RM1_1_8]|nr:mechanosensitive ion channel [Synechococcales cyanobacterium RM1_1_8]NJR71569.1 mechanosensitive ion channel [Synechococcales cyanobacterium CRU_2_2]